MWETCKDAYPNGDTRREPGRLGPFTTCRALKEETRDAKLDGEKRSQTFVTPGIAQNARFRADDNVDGPFTAARNEVRMREAAAV